MTNPGSGDNEPRRENGAFEVEPIRVSGDSTRERKRRQRELWLAFFGALLIIGLTWAELKYIGVDSYLFLPLFNFNFVLLAVILFVVIRNIVKLLLERKRRVLGSRLRTRLVLAFMILTLAPTLLMFFIAVQFVRTGIDYWFQTKIEGSMEQSLELGQDVYVVLKERPRRVAVSIEADIRTRRFAWGGTGMGQLMVEKKSQLGLGLLGVFTPELTEQNWHMDPEFEPAWREFRDSTDWWQLGEEDTAYATILRGVYQDVVICALPVDKGKTGFLVVGEGLGSNMLEKMDRVVRGVEEYQTLLTLKDPLKLALYLTMGLMTGSIVLGSIWFGFRLAKEISAPVQALAIGTQRIARGDLSVRLEDKSTDELGFLVQSFNRMAEDLEEGRERLTRANQRLNQQNLELAARGSYIEALLNNIAAGVISLDSQGRVNTVNKAAESMLGLDARSLVGQRPLEALVGEHRRLLRQLLDMAASGTAGQWQEQITLTLGSREMKLLVNVVELKLPDGARAGLVAVFEDITELEKMQRVAAWREVARRIAHEIKNPLTPIKLSAQRLEKRFGSTLSDPVFLESIRLIVRQVENMQAMVQEFSAFAKLPEVVLRPGSLTALLEEVRAMFATSHGGISWTLDVSHDLPKVRFDAEGLRRVLVNLLGNAAEALEGNGVVEIAAAFDPILKLVVIEIRDDGPGLTEDERSRVFEPYFSRKKGGTGLGLTIARSIVSDHHGFLRVRPNQPHGSIFVIELPAA
ncbi:multi-sensor signal transduction histidine kinase [Alkalidesulfovibrio alkalitolerans DSM 16529]|uniref:histidine kinase n=1 Tax=Alkalidesulfovibrio alkalitolerans DSM 16529 TaxID=1121439 RepID=S7TC71_9BACT|nr:ATP-binding protein [Alkalidesulfovibrio alkalitolerans]EPR34221.1 multi-sensor signal transduction histidine kinase [Alkalidesulfovibrio alkalitolerans DSM 16529]